MRHNHDERLLAKLLRELIRLVEDIIARLEASETLNGYLIIQGVPMANYQLNAGDSVTVTLVVADDETGDVVTPDAGSVTAVLSDSTDSVVDNGDGTFTLTAGAALSSGNTLTVNGTVNGVAFGPVGGAVGTYDVDADVTPPDTFTGTITFGTESAPVGVAESTVPEVDLAQETTANRPNGVE